MLNTTWRARGTLLCVLSLWTFSGALDQVGWAITILPGVAQGVVTNGTLNEISGIADSRSLPGVMWMHNDSNHPTHVYAVNKATGAVLNTYNLTGATLGDWEDMSIGPKPGSGNYLYMGDIGDNERVRSSFKVYRLDEPTTLPGSPTTTNVTNTAVTLTYQDGAQNSESMFVDPISNELYIITKNPSAKVYHSVGNVFAPGANTTLQLLGSLNPVLATPSAADISPDGRYILVRNRSTTARLYARSNAQSVWDALQGTAINVTLRVEPQGEAIGWAADGNGFYSMSEFDEETEATIYFYAFVPEPASFVLLGMGAIAMLVGRFVRRRRI